MKRRRRRHDDGYEPPLADGETYRVPMALRDSADSWRDDMVAHFNALQTIDNDARRAALDDGARRFGLSDGLALLRPGFRYSVDAAALARVEEAYRLRDAADENAWRTPPRRDADPNISRAGSSEFVGAFEGSPCMVPDTKQAGTFRRSAGGSLVCVANGNGNDDAQPRRDSATTRRMSATDAALAARAWEDENAWRGPEWLAQHRPAEFRR
jgi:hypothetical protein